MYSNLKGIISVRGKKAFGFSPEATRGRTEQNITNARFFRAIKIIRRSLKKVHNVSNNVYKSYIINYVA